MDKFTLLRYSSSEQGTRGILTGLGASYDSLELPWRDNARGKSCIPVGVYEVVRVKSPRFGLVYHVKDVPGRTAILIHSGNFGGNKDAGFDTHIEGCILLGCAGVLQNTHGVLQRAVVLSKATVRKFMSATNGRPFMLEVRNADSTTVPV